MPRPAPAFNSIEITRSHFASPSRRKAYRACGILQSGLSNYNATQFCDTCLTANYEVARAIYNLNCDVHIRHEDTARIFAHRRARRLTFSHADDFSATDTYILGRERVMIMFIRTRETRKEIYIRGENETSRCVSRDEVISSVSAKELIIDGCARVISFFGHHRAALVVRV